MSARLDGVTMIERRTLPVPFGHHVYVVSDLSLTPTTDAASRPVRELLDLLGDIDDAAVVVVAGNLFDPEPTSDLGKFVEATLTAMPELRDALRDFCAQQRHRLVILPGSQDVELRCHARAQALIEELGATLASDLVLQVASASGVRDLAVAAGTYVLDVAPVNAKDRADARALEDPQGLERFVASRFLYRRFGGWVWLPIAIFVLADLWSAAVAVVGHLSHHRYTVAFLHAQGFWFSLAVDLAIVAVAETVLAALVGLLVRRRFRRRALVDGAELSDALAVTRVGDVDGLEFARRVVERGGAGAIIGGAPRPALANLDGGVSATPGPSRVVLVERRGRFGLPPVFSSYDRLGVVEVEAASTLQVRLVVGESPRRRGTLLEAIVAGPERQPAPKATSTVGSWPSGRSFPPTAERLNDQRRQRAVRRWISGLVFLDGLLNVAVTTVRPLRSHLRLELSILPIEVVKSAAVLVAVAGIAMIMLSRGLRRGQRRSWFIAVSLLAVTVVAHPLRGEAYISLAIAGVLLVLLVGQRRYFQATSDRASVANALPRLALMALVAIVAATVGFEATVRHHLPTLGVVFVACAERLVGQYDIALPDRVADLVDPTLLAIGVSLIVLALYFVTRPVVDRRLSSAARSTERRLAELRAREIVRRHGEGTLDYFALRDDKQFFFFRDTLVAYAVYGGVALVSPDPIGPNTERTEALRCLPRVRRVARLDDRRDGSRGGVARDVSRGGTPLPLLG